MIEKKRSDIGKEVDKQNLVNANGLIEVVSRASKTRILASLQKQSISHQNFSPKNPSTTQSQKCLQLPIITINRLVKKNPASVIPSKAPTDLVFPQIDLMLPGRRRWLACLVHIVSSPVFSVGLGASPSEQRLVHHGAEDRRRLHLGGLVPAATISSLEANLQVCEQPRLDALI